MEKDTLLVLLCYKLRVPQNGHWQSWRNRERARMIRSVAMEFGLCRWGRIRSPGLESWRELGS
jgi:hypothetical protein